MKTRFDLENDILSLSNIAEDLDTLASAIMETNLDTDETVNAIIGLATMTRLKVDKTFDTFKAALRLDEYKNIGSEPAEETSEHASKDAK